MICHFQEKPMPDGPQGKDNFEYEDRQPRHKFKSTGSEEELGDMHYSTENYTVALEYYDKALQRIQTRSGDPAELVRIYRKISDSYRKKGLLREAMSFLESASSNCAEDDEIGRGTLLCRRGIIFYERGDVKGSLREACSAYKVLRTSDEHREVAHTQLLIANCYARLGRNDEAEQYFLDALSSYRRIGDSVGESYVLNNLGLFHKNACRWGRALQFLGRSLEICDEVGLTQHRARVLLNMGIVHLKKRDFASAESSFCAARDMAKRLGDDLKYAKATLMLGVKETRTSNLLSAEKHLLEARVLAERRSYLRESALADEFLGDLMYARGDLEGAMENYALALNAATKINPDGDVVAEVQRRMMQVLLARKKAADVLALGEKAMRTCRKSGEMHEIGFVERMIGRAHALLKEDEPAEKYMNLSIRTFLSVNNPYEAHRSGLILGEHLQKKSERRSSVMARSLVGETVSFFERTEEFGDLAESRFLLARIEESLGSRDECLLHLYEAQRIAEELRDRNLIRRLRRMRRKVEASVTDAGQRPARGTMPDELSDVFIQDPQLRSYLDYILKDLMRKITAGHGFVALTDGNGGEPLVLARRRVSEETTARITTWYLAGDDTDTTDNLLVSDVAKDRRLREIIGELPGGAAPVYFHPLTREGRAYGLLFFQSEERSGAPRIGPMFEVVSTYAGFIGFLVRSAAAGTRSEKRRSRGDGDAFSAIITGDEKMRRILDLAGRVAESDSTVLLMGETGTGKGLLARAIHDLSRRSSGKFVHVNCAALPETILESELFGHVKGSFTGAVGDKKGLLAEADGGTMFLDEIGKAPLSIQGKLLQFLDTRKVRPVGGNEMFPVDVRLIFASKTDLMRLCSEGRMLEDFFYRINDFPLTIPSLRDRVGDIPMLAEHHLGVCCSEMDRKVMGFSAEAMDYLKGCDWPGNVRELGKVIKRAVILTEPNGVIGREHLLFDGREAGASREEDPATMPEMIESLERRMVAEALDAESWNRKAAARRLGISYPTILKKIRDYGIEQGG